MKFLKLFDSFVTYNMHDRKLGLNHGIKIKLNVYSLESTVCVLVDFALLKT